MPNWRELAYAQQMRDVVRELVRKEVSRIRPTSSLATVESIDTANERVHVIYPGDTESVPVRYYTVRPMTGGGPGVGDVVRIVGEGPRNHVAEVVKGNAFMNLGGIALTALQTTGSAANLFVDATTGVVSRVTSSLRYKKNIEPVDVPDDAVARLRPIQYQQKTDDSATYLGLIAEELEEIGDPALDLLLVRDSDGDPDSINYDRVAVALIPVIQRLLQRVSDLEEELRSESDSA